MGVFFKVKLAKITEKPGNHYKKNRVKNNELNRKLDVKLYYRLITMTEPGLKVSNNTNRHTCFASYSYISPGFFSARQ